MRTNTILFSILHVIKARPKNVKFGQDGEGSGDSNYTPQTRNGKRRLFPWRESSLAQNAVRRRNRTALSPVISKG